MEFKVYQKELELQSRGWIPTFHDISREVMEIVKMSGVKNGTVTIASHHTTCSVMVQECSHDIDSFDLEYLQHDLLDIMRKLTALNEEGTSIILITHDNKLAQMAKRIVTIQDGRIVSDQTSEGVKM